MSITTQDPTGGKNSLNLAALAARTEALGPGPRAVVWVQGCPFDCRGCLAPRWIPAIPALELRPEEVLERLDLTAIRGLTFSGGEPMQQAGGLAALARLARQKKDIDLICFTGYRYERLISNPPGPDVAGLLAEIDVLIDGPYVAALNDGRGLRGSSNQRILHLTPRLRGLDLEAQQRRLEITITDGELAFIGIPTPGVLSVLEGAADASPERMR